MPVECRKASGHPHPVRDYSCTVPACVTKNSASRGLRTARHIYRIFRIHRKYGARASFPILLESIITGRETYIAIGASQIISNVPTALLLSGFTTNYKALIIGTNLGGLGTLIASMASLISYKQIAREYPGKKGKYFLWFTVVNVVFLAGLMGMYSLTS